MKRAWIVAAGLALACIAPGCSTTSDPAGAVARSATPTTRPTADSIDEALDSLTDERTEMVPVDSDPGAVPRPDWLGTRPLPLSDQGYGRIEPTPPELVDRRFVTVDVVPPPRSDEYGVVVESVSDDVLARSTWTDDCPVHRDALRYVTLPFWGFDGALHTGELLIHVNAVEAVTAGFEVLFADRFPIEEMRITHPAELDAPPTGDGNNTSAFVCRPGRGSSSWSQHAYGLAVDINPFHNPYVKGEVVLPELASAYIDRSAVRPGMLDSHAVSGFTAGGWGWGGMWSSALDYMHLSSSGT